MQLRDILNCVNLNINKTINNNISPDGSSSNIRVDGVPVPGTGVKPNNGYSLDLSLGYIISDRWAIELLADLSSKHKVSAHGLGSLGLHNGTNVVEVNALPPTVFLQYQFSPQSSVRPYLGLGVNFTTHLNDKLTPAAKDILGASNLSLDNTWGYAAQFGIDWELRNNWSFNVDIKYIDIDTTAAFDTAIGRASVDVDISPLVFGIGFGKTF